MTRASFTASPPRRFGRVGHRPIVNWKRPSVGWVSTDTTRQLTVYVPGGSGLSPTRSSAGVPGDTWAFPRSTGCFVDRQDGLGADLKISPAPDDAGLDGSYRLRTLASGNRRRKRDLDERDQPAERLAQADVLHAALQVRQAVFEREPVIEIVRVWRAGAFGFGRKIEAEIAGNRKGPQIGKLGRKIAETLSKVQGRRQRRDIRCAQRGDSPGMRPADIEADEAERLVRRIDKELVLQAGMQSAESGRARHVLWLKVRPSLTDRKAEIRRDPFCEIDVKIEFLRAVETGGRASDRRQRHLVGNEGFG